MFKNEFAMIAALALSLTLTLTAQSGEVVFGIGASTEKNCRNAAETAAGKARQALSGAKPKLVLINIMAKNQKAAEDAVAGAKEVFPDTPIYGSTSSGAITDDEIVLNGVSILVFAGDLQFAAAGAPVDPKGDACGRAIGEQLSQKPLPEGKSRFLFVTGDAHWPKNQHIAEGVNAALNLDIPAAGSAADGPKLCVVDGQVKAKYGIGVIIAGDFSLGYGIDVSQTQDGQRDSSIDGMLAAGRRACESATRDGKPKLLLVFDCVGRRNGYRKEADGLQKEQQLFKQFAPDGQVYAFFGQGEYGRKSPEAKSYAGGFHIAMVAFLPPK